MNILLITLAILGFGLAGFMAFIAFKFNQKINDLESFIINLNDDINAFQKSVDRITRSNIMVYDELVFDVMNQCKAVKIKLDQYLSKYDEYKHFIYTEDIEEEVKPEEVIGIIRKP